MTNSNHKMYGKKRHFLDLFFMIIIFVASLLIRLSTYKGNTLYTGGSYYHIRMIDYIIYNGNRPSFDVLSNAPSGVPVSSLPFFHYFFGYSYHLFSPFLDIIRYSSLLSAIIGSCIPILMYLFLNKYVNRYISLFCSLFLSVIPDFLSFFTTAGVLQFESLAGVFALLLTITFFSKDNDNVVGLSSGILMALLGLTWRGSIFFVFLFSAYVLTMLLLERLDERTKTRYVTMILLYFIIIGTYQLLIYPTYQTIFMIWPTSLLAFFVVFLLSFDKIRKRNFADVYPVTTLVILFLILVNISVGVSFAPATIKETTSAVSLNKILPNWIYYYFLPDSAPSLYGEIEKRGHFLISYNQKPSFQQIYQNFNIFFFISFLGLIPVFREHKNYQIFIFLWFIFSLIGLFNKVEFLFLFSFACVMMSALFFNEIVKIISNLNRQQEKKFILMFFLISLIAIPTSLQYVESKKYLSSIEPSINEYWISSLT